MKPTPGGAGSPGSAGLSRRRSLLGGVRRPRPTLWLAAAVASLGSALAVFAAEASWQPTTWRGEEALQSTHGPWRAVVSIERSRLVVFGRADSAENLLYESATRDDPAGWGGHRLWLGPQVKWAKIWPPPEAWEHSRPESVTVDGGTLWLVLRDPGDGWPRLTRTYRWGGFGLICGAEFHGGTRPAQFIQIVQIPASDLGQALARPDQVAPQGYVRLPAGEVQALTTAFMPPPQVSRERDVLQLRHIGRAEKLGFRPQTLFALRAGVKVLSVARADLKGTVVGEPDAGFPTMVFIGGREPFIELEQLSPLFAAGGDALFEIEVTAGPER